jgi:hypothetical protein
MFETLVVGAYTTVSSLRVLSYLPQIVRLAKAHDGVAAISLMTWNLWLVSHVMTVIYAAAIVRDPLLIAIFAGNGACCALVVGIVLWKRRRHAASGAILKGST